jgi:hypothetical protein
MPRPLSCLTGSQAKTFKAIRGDIAPRITPSASRRQEAELLTG